MSRHWTSGPVAVVLPRAVRTVYDGSQLRASAARTIAAFLAVTRAASSGACVAGRSNFSPVPSDAERTIRTERPTSRAARWVPSSSSVRRTRMRAGSPTSTSVTTDRIGTNGARIPTGPSGTGSIATRDSTSSRSPWSSSSFDPPRASRSVPTRRGRARTSTARTRSPMTTNACLPFVFTRSGSSTPSSWTFVPENASAAVLPTVSPTALGGSGPTRAPAKVPSSPYGPTSGSACRATYARNSGHPSKARRRLAGAVAASVAAPAIAAQPARTPIARTPARTLISSPCSSYGADPATSHTKFLRACRAA